MHAPEHQHLPDRDRKKSEEKWNDRFLARKGQNHPDGDQHRHRDERVHHGFGEAASKSKILGLHSV